MPFTITGNNETLALKATRDTRIEAVERALSFAGLGMSVRITDPQGRHHDVAEFPNFLKGGRPARRCAA
jgi:LPS O-antigen subunit length determinant protein (WzzB/FepE family)